MTLADLNGLRYLDDEISDLEEQIESLRTQAEKCTQSFSDMPSGSGVSDRVGKMASQIADYTNLLVSVKADRIQKSAEIHSFLLGIEDDLIRRTFYLRFIQGLPWIEVGRRLGGGNNEENSRMRVVRYLNKINEGAKK